MKMIEQLRKTSAHAFNLTTSHSNSEAVTPPSLLLALYSFAANYPLSLNIVKKHESHHNHHS